MASLVVPSPWLTGLYPYVRWVTLQACALRVVPDEGAGLLLEASSNNDGYLIKFVDSWFEQHAALRAGAVIIEINGEKLLGLDPDSLERTFEANFQDGARLLIVDADELRFASHPAHRYWYFDGIE